MMRLSAPIHQLKRRARLLARSERIALHEALDRVAGEEGFAGWSLLSSQAEIDALSTPVLSKLQDGELLLLGARPGHGKTSLGIRLLLDAAGEGRRAVFFTLEYSHQEARARISRIDDGKSGLRSKAGHRGKAGLGDKVEVVTSDEISADYIIRHLSGSAPGTVAIIDYLQILDQQRSKPALSDQMLALRNFARENGMILGFVSQIDRSYDPRSKPMPDVVDVRLPNLFDLRLFSKACFLQDGAVRLQHLD